MRSLVGLDKQAVQQAFADFLEGKTVTAGQIDFVNLIVAHLTKHGAMDPGLLYEPPFTDYAPQGPDQVFEADQALRLVQTIQAVNNSADIRSA